MRKNHFEQLIMASLKFFFDFDPAYCKYVSLTALLLPGIFRMLVALTAISFYDGILTVKEDVNTMSAMIVTFKEKWNNSETRVILLNSLRILRTNTDKGFRYRR